MVNITPLLLYPGNDPVPTVWEAGWDPGPFRTGEQNHASTRVRSPDCPACSKSLYLCYPSPPKDGIMIQKPDPLLQAYHTSDNGTRALGYILQSLAFLSVHITVGLFIRFHIL
jgi:hypothetical protein